tara:strand:+ start:397 stop:585 length:189 start_codon:yes stop_codon:yes gene_type:complete
MKTTEALYIIKNLIKEDVDECCEASMDKEKVTNKLKDIKKFLEELDEKENPKDLNDPFTGYC